MEIPFSFHAWAIAMQVTIVIFPAVTVGHVISNQAFRNTLNTSYLGLIHRMLRVIQPAIMAILFVQSVLHNKRLPYLCFSKYFVQK